MQGSDTREQLRQVYQQDDPGKKLFIPAKPKVNPSEKDRMFRACAYCRVSTDSEEQLSSYELQQKHYRQLAQDHPNWDLRKIYADEGISGTSLKNRTAFNEMIEECRKGTYDLIVTKSVSRFARNLVDCISLVRMLKGLNPPVGVFFETDNLYTLAENTEFILSFLATIAQEESVKKREAMNWSLAQRFKDGKLLTPALLGYDRARDVTGRFIKYAPLVVNEKEAEIVRFIFDSYIAGWSLVNIADFLTDIGCSTKTGSTKWTEGGIRYILGNERYCGDVLTWKTFTSDLYEHKHRKNRQDRDQYLYKDRHEAIISTQQFEAVQIMMLNRRHHVRGGLPSLQVIDEGIFQGFIPINHHYIIRFLFVLLFYLIIACNKPVRMIGKPFYKLRIGYPFFYHVYYLFGGKTGFILFPTMPAVFLQSMDRLFYTHPVKHEYLGDTVIHTSPGISALIICFKTEEI